MLLQINGGQTRLMKRLRINMYSMTMLITVKPISVAFELEEQIVIFGALLHPQLPTNDPSAAPEK